MRSRLLHYSCHFSVLQTRGQPRFNGEVKPSMVEELSWVVAGTLTRSVGGRAACLPPCGSVCPQGGLGAAVIQLLIAPHADHSKKAPLPLGPR